MSDVISRILIYGMFFVVGLYCYIFLLKNVPRWGMIRIIYTLSLASFSSSIFAFLLSILYRFGATNGIHFNVLYFIPLAASFAALGLLVHCIYKIIKGHWSV